jgi:hypothetical protein
MKLFLKNIAKIFFTLLSIIISDQALSQHKNICISRSGDPEETTLCINPQKPNVLVAAANTESYYFSSDTGKTWRNGSLRSTYGVWGDPCLLIDSNGTYYYFHLSKMSNGNAYDRLVCQKSFDKGVTWTNGSYLGLNGDLSQDKEWAVMDPKSNYIYVLWTEQIKKQSHGGGITITDINVSISKDLGKTWSQGKKINEKPGPDFENWKTVIGAMPEIGTNGQVYATWVGPEGILFNKSLDSGKTWKSKDIKVTDLNNGKWAATVPGMYRCYIFPIIACDRSNGPNKGTIYITWFDKNKAKAKDDMDIWLSKSTDEGTTWSKPQRVNNDSTSRYQYFPWISIDQTNGNIYIAFYDRRDHTDNKTDLFMARSIDGAKTFTNFKVSERSFTPNSETFMGDYIGMVANNNIVRPIWTMMDDHSGLSIWTAIINLNAIK